MKKKLLIVLIMSMIILTGCNNESNNKEENTITTENMKMTEESKPEISADGLLQAFKDSGMSVIDEIVYTSETDPNEKLGRPGEYIAKINFNDSNFFEEGEEPELSIEVFENEEDMIKRRDYIQEITDTNDMNAFKYYIYNNGMFLFRIPYSVTPEVAAEYEDIFNRYMNGEIIEHKETKTEESTEKTGLQKENIEYKNISFENNDKYEITEDENTLKITYEQGKAFAIIQPTDAGTLKISSLDDEEVLSLALYMISKMFEEKQAVEEYNLPIDGVTAKAESFIGKLNDNWIRVISVAFRDDDYCYNIYYSYTVAGINENTSTYSDEFITMLESIKFINQ